VTAGPAASTPTLDKLIGTWRVWQLRGGHRFSTDDLVTAWRATVASPDARTLLDLGAGIGSVGLSALYRLPQDATLTAIEIQEISAELLGRTVVENVIAERVEVIRGDLRDASVLPAGRSFELVTGSPPYVPVGSGHRSPHPQRAGARLELAGSVFDYCAAARRWLAPGGRFCFVFDAGDPRAEEAPRAHGLTVVERYDYVFGKGGSTRPRISTFVCAREEDVPTDAPRATGRLVIRGADGEWTEEYGRFRQQMGITSPG
jgi:tRNA1(Val) A37 N6-methylase TrmN6